MEIFIVGLVVGGAVLLLARQTSRSASGCGPCKGCSKTTECDEPATRLTTHRRDLSGGRK